LAAFNVQGVEVRIQGGAQDGVGKAALGGKVVILKGRNAEGRWVDGSVGKSFAYGAQRGLFLIQGNADARFCIRLSGADVVLGGKLTQPIDDSLGNIGSRANIKGFAFEYMTAGRAVVLGDPGPWICSGMTGGVVYLRLIPEMGLDEEALRRRLARGAKVLLSGLGPADIRSLQELLGAYQEELARSGQEEEAEEVAQIIRQLPAGFLKVTPIGQQEDPSISTE
jgi:glutamate synthase (NADPH/NADH) large chain